MKAGIILGILLAFGVAFILVVFVYSAFGRDDGRYKDMDPDMKMWFNQLTSGKGLCCSFADGFSISDVDWDTAAFCEEGKPGGDGAGQTKVCSQHYRVRLHGEWVVVPDAAVVEQPNKFGPAVVWPYTDADGATQIRCFIPGAGA